MRCDGTRGPAGVQQSTVNGNYEFISVFAPLALNSHRIGSKACDERE